MKKVLCIILTVLLIFSSLPMTAAASSLYLSSYTVNTSIITENSQPTFMFGVVGATDGLISISTDSSSAFQLTGGNIIQTVAVSGGMTNPVTFHYDGSSKDMVITITDPASGASNTQTILIAEAMESSGADLPNQGGEPQLLISGDALTLSRGQDENITFTITNISNYPAQNIYCTVSADGSSIYPSTLSNRLSIGNILPGGTQTVSIPVTVSPDAALGYTAIGLQFAFDNGLGSNYEQSESIGVTIDSSGSSVLEADVAITSAALSPSVVGSDNLTALTVGIRNNGSRDVSDVQISLDGYSSSGFSLSDSVGTRRFTILRPGMEVSATFPLKVAPTMESGSHSMTVKITYHNGNETVTKEEEVFLSFTRNPSAGVQVSSAKLNTSTPGTSNRVKLTVGLTNKDTAAVSNVRTYLEGLSVGTFTLDGMFGSIDRASLGAGASTTLEFPLYVSESLTTGNYPLTVVTKYLDASGTEQTKETEIYLYINRPESEKEPEQNLPESTPRVIISKYNVSTELIEAGNEFTLDFTLKNTSATTAIKNLKIVLSSADGVYLPAEGSSSFYEPLIAADGEADFSIRLIPKRDAETKTYPLTITIDYENEKNTSYNVTETLSFSVNQEQRLELNNISFMPNGTNPGTLSLQYINKGKAVLYNMSIRVDGPFTSEYGVQYIGNFGIGSSDYYEDYITPTETGELTGKLIVEYEDVNGKKTEVIEEFSAYIEEPIMMDDPGVMSPDDMYMDDMYMEEPASEGIPWLWIGIAGGAVLLVGGIIVLIVVRRKRRKETEMAIDE